MSPRARILSLAALSGASAAGAVVLAVHDGHVADVVGFGAVALFLAAGAVRLRRAACSWRA